MPTDIDILEEMLSAKALVEVTTSGKRKRVTLKEHHSSPPYEVKILGLPDEVAVIRVDAFELTKDFFQGTKGERKRADFAIFAQEGKDTFVLFIEMKSGIADRKGVVQQLKGARCLVKYLRALGAEFWDCASFLSDYYERFVCIDKISMAKRKTQHGKTTGTADVPDRFLKISKPGSLEFKKIIGK